MTQLPPEAKTTRFSLEIFYSNTLKTDLLKSLAEYECLTIRDLASIHFPKVNENTIFSIWRSLKRLKRDGFVRSIPWGDAPWDYGTKPHAWGLAKPGVLYALEHWPETDPVEWKADHSTLTVGHELQRAHIHQAMNQFSKTEGWKLKWRKSNLYTGRKPEPDDIFALTNPQLPEGKNTLRFILESERRKKDFKELDGKIEAYEAIYGTDEAERRFKTKQFRVIFPFENTARMQNYVRHLAGACDCTATWKGKLKHTCLKFPTRDSILPEPVKKEKYWFTTDAAIRISPGEKIFITPKDYQDQDADHSFESAFR